MYWWPEAPNPQTMVPRFGQYNSSSSSDSASRGWHWNRGRVQYQLPCLKWTQNPDNWATLYQRQCPVFRNSWFFQGVGLSFIPKLQATTETTGWLHSGTSNQNWGFIQGGVWIACLGVRLTRALMHAAFGMTSFATCVVSVWRSPQQVVIISSIWRFIAVVTTGRVCLHNNLCCQYLLLVSVTFIFFTSLVWVTVFRSLQGRLLRHLRLLSLIHNIQCRWFSTLYNVSASSSDLSCLSLVKIEFEFSICVLDIWLKVSTVKLWLYYSSSVITLCITSLIFSLDNGT